MCGGMCGGERVCGGRIGWRIFSEERGDVRHIGGGVAGFAGYACSAVCIEGSVYVVGGWDDGSCLKSAEMYDTSAGQWRALPNMSVARVFCAAVCMEGNVYVVGGSDGHTSASTRHASVECFDPVANEWRTLPSMSTARWLCAAAVAELGHA